MRILIADPRLDGHHLTYLKLLVHGARKSGADVVIGGSWELAEMYGFASEYDNGSAIDVCLVECSADPSPAGSPIQLMKKDFQYWSFYRSVFRQASKIGKVDRVVVPYLDYFFWSASIFGSPFGNTAFDAILMRTAFLQQPDIRCGQKLTFFERGRRILWPRLLRVSGLRTLFYIDPTLRGTKPVKASTDQFASVRYLRDPAEQAAIADCDASREKLGIPASARVILSYGLQNRRKGLPELMAALDTMASVEQVYLLVVGKQDEQMAHFLSSRTRAQYTLQCLDKYVDQETEAAVFAAADIVWIGYRGHASMSGVLVKAGLANLPVIASDEGVIGWMASKYGLGPVVNTADPSAIHKSIDALLNDVSERERAGRNGYNLFRTHTVDNFQTCIFGDQE